MKILSTLILASLFCTSTSYAAGFDCSKAKSSTEKTICSTTSLSSLDEILVLSFNKASAGNSDPKALKTAQQGWLKTREACASNIDCITKTYTARISELVNLVAKNQKKTIATNPSPTKPASMPQSTSTQTESKPVTKPTGITLTGTILDYECGDNCYLTIKDEQGAEHVALCTAPQCDSWNEVSTMPKSFLKKKIQVTLGRAKQYDSAGNEMGEMDSFDSIMLLE